MSITRVGSTKKFAENWDNIFGGSRGQGVAKTPVKKAIGKKAATQRAAPKKSAKKSASKLSGRVPTSRAKKHAAGVASPGGDAKVKKSVAKRKAKTRKQRPRPVLQQMELF